MRNLVEYINFKNLNESYTVEPISDSEWENISAPSLPKLNQVKGDKTRFAKKLTYISNKLGVKPESLMYVMNKECGMDHTISNSIGATGLIQFMPATLRGMINKETNSPYTASDLKKMTADEQLDLVYSYLKKNLKNVEKTSDGKVKHQADLYLGIFLPVTIGKPDSYNIIDYKDSKLTGKMIVDQNPGLFKGNPQGNLGKLRHYIETDVMKSNPNDWDYNDDEDNIAGSALPVDKDGSISSLLNSFSEFVDRFKSES